MSNTEDNFIAERNYYDGIKEALGYETVFDLDVGIKPLDFKIFTDKPRTVKYKIIDRMGDSFDDVDWVTFNAVAKDGTLGALWAAAEDCFQQAKENNGDWHYFVEDFAMQDDGTLELVTGS